MAYAIALTLDAALDNEVRQVWRDFEEAGIGKTPGQFDESPHVTLSVIPAGNRDALIKLVDSIAIVPTKIKLIPFGAFLGKTHILYYNAVLSKELLQAHAQLCDVLRQQKIEHDPIYLPGSVVFHCTLAVEITDDRLLDGVNICMKRRDVLTGVVDGVELIEFFPVKVIHERRL